MKRKESKYHRRINIISLLFVIIFLIGAALVGYALLNKDMNTSILGLGLMFFSLVFGAIIFSHARKKHLEKHTRTRIKHTKERYPLLLFIFFALVGIAGMIYFYLNKNTQFIIASSSILLLCIIGIIIIIIKKKGIKFHFKILHFKKIHFKKKEHIHGKEPEEEEHEIKKVEESEEQEKNIKWEVKKEVTFKKIKKKNLSKYYRIVKEKLNSLERGKTPLDVLYWLLEQEKQIKFPEIARIFGINIKRVEDWAQILEANGFAEIQYPAFGSPWLILKTKNNK